MELFINNNLDAAYNLALEEFMTRNHNSGFLMLWRNANAIIVGRNQNTAAEINAALKGVDPNSSTEDMIRHALRAMVMKG